MANFKEIGNDVTLEINGEEFAITNVSYSESPETSETQFNTGLNPDLVVTGVSYSGSFEHSGSNVELQDTLYGTQEENQSSVPVMVESITIIDSEREYIFENVIVEGRDKDFPADDRTEVSYDFMAERLLKESADSSGTDDLGLNRLEGQSPPNKGPPSEG